MKPMIVVVLLITSLLPVHAQRCSARFDPVHSTARLFVGTTADPESFNVAVARAIGQMVLDRDRPAESAFELALYPAGTGPVGPAGRLASGQVPNTASYTEISFKSTSTVAIDDGLWVAGTLTLTRVEYSADVVLNEAYSGPTYNNPVVTTSSRETAFFFPGLKFDCAAPTAISASAQVGYERFKGLWQAALNTNWPPVIENEQCQNPTTGGEDYAGPSCTGKTVAVIPRGVVPSVGEDYHGFIGAPVAGNQMTIRFDLKAVPAASSSEISGS